MTRHETAEGRTEDLLKVDLELLRSPLDFIVAEHAKHREMCRRAEMLTGAECVFDIRLAAEFTLCLYRFLILHIMDEERDLFPLLQRMARRYPNARKAAPSEDGDFDDLLRQLSAEHKFCRSAIKCLKNMLATEASQPHEQLRQALLTHAQMQGSHLAVEKAVIIPFAKTCLRRADQNALALGVSPHRAPPSSNWRHQTSLAAETSISTRWPWYLKNRRGNKVAPVALGEISA